MTKDSNTDKTKDTGAHKTQLNVALIGLFGTITAAFIATVVPMIITKWPTPTATTSPGTPIPSRVEVQTLYLSFSSPSDYPGESFDIPHHVRTSGITEYVKGNNRFLWIAICPQTTKNCSLRELKLDEAGNWNTFIDIGGEVNDCGIFDVIFVVANDSLHTLFKELATAGISQDNFETKDFVSHIPFAVRPARTTNDQVISCQTVSS